MDPRSDEEASREQIWTTQNFPQPVHYTAPIPVLAAEGLGCVGDSVQQLDCMVKTGKLWGLRQGRGFSQKMAFSSLAVACKKETLELSQNNHLRKLTGPCELPGVSAPWVTKCSRYVTKCSLAPEPFCLSPREMCGTVSVHQLASRASDGACGSVGAQICGPRGPKGRW